MNDPVLRDRVEKFLACMGGGLYRLPPDVQIEGGRLATPPDKPIGRS